MKTNNNKVDSSIQTKPEIDNLYRDFGGFGMTYDDFEHLFGRTWEEGFT